MNLNLLEALDQLQDEKNIEKEEVIDILEKAPRVLIRKTSRPRAMSMSGSTGLQAT